MFVLYCCIAVADEAGADFHLGWLLLKRGFFSQTNMISSKFDQRDNIVYSICLFCFEKSRKEKTLFDTWFFDLYSEELIEGKTLFNLKTNINKKKAHQCQELFLCIFLHAPSP